MDSTGSASSDNQAASMIRKMCLACNENFDEIFDACPKCRGTQLVRIGGDENLGRVISEKYKIIEMVGKGGMGAVYLAEVLGKKNTWVAVKMLHAQLSEDKVSVKRFQQEASAASDLQHPNLIQQYDYGMIDEKQPFLVMEYLQGDSLNYVLREDGPLNPVIALRIFSQVMDGLKYAHDKGVVHRDIKPSNILLIKREGEEDLVKVLDFGLAKLMPWSGKESQHLTKTGEVFGSPIYMSPEQCMGKKLEPSSDIYSLGITLYESLTGKPPFKGQNVVQTASKHLSEQPPPFETICPELNLPLNLQNVVFKALEKDPANRYLDMAHFKENLVYAVTGQGKASSRVQAAMAMSADATQPVKKVDIDSLKAGAQSVANMKTSDTHKAKPLPVGLIAGGVVALLIAGGGIGYMMAPKGATDKGSTGGVKQPLFSMPQKAQGTIYYVAMKTSSKARKGFISEVHLQTKNGIVRLTSKLIPNSHQLLELHLGKQWAVDYKGDEKTGEMEGYSATGDDTAVTDANNTVLNYFQTLAQKDYQTAYEILGSDYVKKTYKGLDDEKAEAKFADEMKKEGFIDYLNGGDRVQIDSSIPALSLPTGEKNPPIQATKVQTVSPEEVKIMVDTNLFFTKPHGYQCFVIKKENDSWKIADIEQDLKKSDWDAE